MKPEAEKPLESERDQKAAIPEETVREIRFHYAMLRGEHAKKVVAIVDELKALRAERDQLRMERDAAWNEAASAICPLCAGVNKYVDPTPQRDGEDFYHHWVDGGLATICQSSAIHRLARPIPAEPPKEK